MQYWGRFAVATGDVHAKYRAALVGGGRRLDNICLETSTTAVFNATLLICSYMPMSKVESFSSVKLKSSKVW